jgi:hypothetical protein
VRKGCGKPRKKAALRCFGGWHVFCAKQAFRRAPLPLPDKDLDYWTDLARILERGFFDAIFIADVVGYYDVYKGENYYALHQGVQIPVNAPLQLAAPIALATEHLGIGIKASTSFEHPLYLRPPALHGRSPHQGPGGRLEHRHPPTPAAPRTLARVACGATTTTTCNGSHLKPAVLAFDAISGSQ